MRRKVVRFGFTGGPLDQQPFFRMRLVAPIVEIYLLKSFQLDEIRYSGFFIEGENLRKSGSLFMDCEWACAARAGTYEAIDFIALVFLPATPVSLVRRFPRSRAASLSEFYIHARLAA